VIKTALALITVLALVFVACSDGDDATSEDPTDTADVGPPSIEGESYTTDLGVQIIEFASGSAEDPTVNGDAVSVHYTGWLEDGTKFDSSRDRGNAFTFVLGEGQVIRGWDDGVLGMSPGDQRRLIIPADLAYGDQARGELIPPEATLIFDVELMGFGRRPAPTEAATD
jgi:peptidylprolyl isomerase